MADPFATGLGTLFAGPRAVAAVHVAVDGTSTAIRVIPRLRSSVEGTVRPRPVRTGMVFDIRASDIEEPVVGDTLIVGAEIYSFVLPPEPDSHRLGWVCDVPLLDRTVALFVAGSSEDAYGDRQPGHSEVIRLPAARVDLTGAELDDVAVSQLTAWQRVRFFMPWSAPIAALKPQDRILDADRYFDIEAIAELGQRAAVEISARARVG